MQKFPLCSTSLTYMSPPPKTFSRKPTITMYKVLQHGIPLNTQQNQAPPIFRHNAYVISNKTLRRPIPTCPELHTDTSPHGRRAKYSYQTSSPSCPRSSVSGATPVWQALLDNYAVCRKRGKLFHKTMFSTGRPHSFQSASDEAWRSSSDIPPINHSLSVETLR